MKSKLRVAFVSSENPLDRKTWSGTHFQIFKALEREFEFVKAITYNNLAYKILGGINKITLPIFNKKYNHQHSFFRAYIQSKGIQRQLKKEKIDIIFCSAGSTEIAFLETDIPIIYLSDSSFGQLAGYYDVMKNVFPFSLNESNTIELKALQKAKHIIYPTDWAKNFTIKNYKIDASKISKIHFGANIDNDQIEYTEKQLNAEKTFNILFLGVFWERKGGDIVLETYKKLLGETKNVHLTICGCIPPEEGDNITVIPFLDKNNPKDFKVLNNLLKNTDLLFVPTRAECYGIVFNEAGAYGVPVLSTSTGGVPEIVINDYNGYTLSLDKTSNDYLKIILLLINNPSLHHMLSINAREKYLQENNWINFGKQLRKIIENNC